jgi:hypothetical protein
MPYEYDALSHEFRPEQYREYSRPEEYRGSGTLAWRVLWVTSAFWIVAVAATPGIWRTANSEGFSAGFSFALGFFLVVVVPYWSIFVLISLPHKDLQSCSWRVWGAWLCITVPLVWYLVSAEVIKGFDPGGWGGALWIVLGFPISVSPIATIIGAIVGDLLFRLYRKRVNKLARG